MNRNEYNSGYLCFLILTKYLNIKVSSKIAEKFGEGCDTKFELYNISKKMDLKIKAGNLSQEKMRKITVPFIVEKKDGSFLIILNQNNDKISILDPIKGSPESVGVDYYNQLTGWGMVIGKKGYKDEENRKFGFSWFIPTILKFKKQFICVLIAVFTIQIIGILTRVKIYAILCRIIRIACLLHMLKHRI